MDTLPLPCTTCPYRRDTPPGIWHPDEYAKLPQYDDGADPLALGIFLCHQGPLCGKNLVCRGWLSVHAESIAVRLAVLQGQITSQQVYAEVATPLYGSGQEAAAAGLAGVNRPSGRAKQKIRKLLDRRSRSK